jgi:hypothetical protein
MELPNARTCRRTCEVVTRLLTIRDRHSVRADWGLLCIADYVVATNHVGGSMSCPQNVRFWATLLMALHPRRGGDCICSPEYPFRRLARIS